MEKIIELKKELNYILSLENNQHNITEYEFEIIKNNLIQKIRDAMPQINQLNTTEWQYFKLLCYAFLSSVK